MAHAPDLDPLFDPDAVCVVGASPDSTYAAGLIDNLLAYGFDGSLSLVNPGRERAWGRPCHDSLDDVPGPIDLVVVCVPRDHVVGIVETAGERGIPAALVISAGFSEADEAGAELEAALAATADQYGIDVCGPNCIGVADAHAGTVLTSTCSRRPTPGRIGLVSQSGALAFTTFFERAADEDVHFAAVASTGNEADLTLTDYVAYMAARPEIDVVCAYVEGIDDPDRFMAVADRAIRDGTPVLAVKVGASAVAEAATLSHTGSVTGNDAAWDAAFDQTGVSRVPDIADLLGRASAHAAYDAPDGARVCVASTSGGLASLLADLADDRGLELPPLPASTERALLEMDELLTFGELHNPADIRGYGAEVLPAIADELFDADCYDAYVFAIGLSAVDDRADTVAAALDRIVDAAPAPTFVLWTGRRAAADRAGPLPYERFRADHPLYYDPARCMDAVASLVDSATARDRRRTGPARADVLDRPTGAATVAVPRGEVLNWADSAALLGAYGIETVRTELATSAAEAADLAERIGFPVVVKVDSRDVLHRTDAGAVRVGVTTAAEATQAFRDVTANVSAYAPDATVDGVLVQPQLEDGVEALVGVTRDDVFGPVVTVATGGTLVEVLDDGVVRIPPMTATDVETALDDLTLDELLAGHRGAKPADRAAFVDLVRRVGGLALAHPIAELDLNPVVVTPDGATAVDALVRTTE